MKHISSKTKATFTKYKVKKKYFIGTIRDHTGPHGTNRSLQNHTEPYKTIRDPTGSYGSIRYLMVPYSTPWSINRTIQDDTGQFSTI